MNELRNSKSDDQLEELLLLTEQMQEELDQKDRTIRELKVQLDESLTLNEKLNSENKTENIQALKNDLRKTKELLQSEKEKTHTVQAMIEECRDKQRQAEQERDYALSHQKKVEIPVEKPVLYQKCGNCKQTAYLKAKERYDTQREKLAGRYKAKTAIYEALMFLLIWYSVSTTLFQMIRSKIFISDCVVFFDTIATFIQNIAGLTILAGKNVAQVSNGISNPVVVGIIYWMIRILISGGCLVGVGILLAFIEIKIAGLYNNFDGLINNTPQTPTVADFEQRAKAGEAISVTDLAKAVKAEKREQPQKKPSILKKLDEYKKQAAQQPKDKQKEHKKDLEV